jgi:acetyltransferase-like isoleucine patch superfamily enzyme
MEAFTQMLVHIARSSVRLMRFMKRRATLLFVNIIAGPAEFQPLQTLRAGCLRTLGCTIAAPSQISEAFYVLNGPRLVIGPGSRIGSFCRIWDFAEVRIGRNLLASHNLTIVAGTHNIGDLAPRPGPVTIGDDVWIGVNVTIVGPVAIGSRCIIGAGAVVIADIPDDVIAAGVPARVLRIRPAN